MIGEPSSAEGVQLLLEFDTQVFGLQSIKDAAYRFSDRLSVDIELEGGKALCRVSPVKTVPEDALQELEKAFRAEVLDCDLRAALRKETEPLRNVILSLAFSRTGLNG